MVPGIGQSPGTPDGAILLPTLSPAQTQSDAGVFQKLVSGSLQQAGGLNTESHTLSGADLVMTESVVAMRQADIAMRLMLQLQGKLVEHGMSYETCRRKQESHSFLPANFPRPEFSWKHYGKSATRASRCSVTCARTSV